MKSLCIWSCRRTVSKVFWIRWPVGPAGDKQGQGFNSGTLWQRRLTFLSVKWSRMSKPNQNLITPPALFVSPAYRALMGKDRHQSGTHPLVRVQTEHSTSGRRRSKPCKHRRRKRKRELRFLVWERRLLLWFFCLFLWHSCHKTPSTWEPARSLALVFIGPGPAVHLRVWMVSPMWAWLTQNLQACSNWGAERRFTYIWRVKSKLFVLRKQHFSPKMQTYLSFLLPIIGRILGKVSGISEKVHSLEAWYIKTVQNTENQHI